MRRSAEITRKRIGEAAYKLFRRQGFGRLSMEEIAASREAHKRSIITSKARTTYWPMS
jgi:AcrR family transcriptional regulator